MAGKKSDGTVKLDLKTGAPAAPKSAKVKAPKTIVVASAQPVVAAGQMKKPAFLDQAVARSGVKRRDAKPAIEAALNELAEALLRGDEINLPPLGKLKVVKTKDLSEGAKALTVKLRTMKDGAGTGKSGVAEPGEEG